MRSMFVMLAGLMLSSAQAGDWIHWRGPEQTGFSRETGLPESIDLSEVGKNNLIWKVPYGGRSAPLILGDRAFTISGYDMSLPTEGERIISFDTKDGSVKWEKRFNVFHTDIVSSRLGWTTMTADVPNNRIYAHTTGGFLFCLNASDGKVIWQRQLTEEFGRVTGYGGRIVSPIFDSGLVIIGMVNGSWGDQARGGNRFVAFDGATGEVVWWNEPAAPIKGTYYSNPVIAVIGGQRLLISGGADGAVHALKVRTGEKVWSYLFSAGVVNPSPVVDGNFVYISHGEENPEGGPIGRVVCLDASKVDPKTKKPALVWENKRLAKRFGLASPALADGRLYVPDDASEIVCFNAKSGKVLWKQKYGTVSRGAPLIADGKLYVFDVNAKLAIWKLKGDEEPEELQNVAIRKEVGQGFVETHGTPIAVNKRLYFLTQDNFYCVGDPSATASLVKYKLPAEEKPFDDKAEAAGLRIFPADITVTPGQTVTLSVNALDANGRVLGKKAEGTWSFPQPALPPTAPKGAAQPPALNVKDVKPEADKVTFTTGPLPNQQGFVEVKAGNLVARARVRVAAKIPYSQDFEKAPVGGSPGGWVNTQGKYVIAEKLGSKVLSKVNNDSRPPIARANGYITSPYVSNYTIESDVYGTEVTGKLPDMGVVNSRYTLILDGKSDPDTGKRQLRIVSWEARPRINNGKEFNWEPATWYRVKLSVTPKDKTALVQAKVWKRGETEPKEWTVSFEDPSPNVEGAAAVYGYVSNVTADAPGSEIFYDNVTITPNK
jgi:outer membrane protein assembly factor BamB